jgi:hypothetical protein
MRQKNVLELFFHIHEPYFSDRVQKMYESYKPQDHIEKYSVSGSYLVHKYKNQIFNFNLY